VRASSRVGVAAAVAGAGWLATFAGCGDDSEGAPIEGLEDVVYVGGATDEALDALLAREPQHDPTKTAVFDWPSDGEQLSAATPSPFCWHIGEPKGAFNRAPERLFRSPDQTGPGWDRLLFPGLAEAHAHGTPISGPVYLITFSGPDGAPLHRGFTTATNFVPSAEAWADLHGAGVPITAVVTWADFESNRIVEGGGPWPGKPITVGIRVE
jgi:hypothetical protein